MRHERSLAGIWQFQLDPEASLTVESLAPDKNIPVPLPWQAAFAELQQYSGFAWYHRVFDIDDEWLQSELLLKFGAVDYWCQVFVNGQLAGQHEGGYTPFSISIKQFARAGENELAVRVYDTAQSQITIPRWPSYPAQTSRSDPPFDENHIPHGKQDWYINVGGIWQDVTLLALASSYVDHAQVSTDIHSGEAKFAIELGGELAELRGELVLTIVGAEHETCATRVTLVASKSFYDARLVVNAPRLWSDQAPNLYTATISLSTGSGEDEISFRFGFREIATREGQLLLNGEPIFLLGALDQDLYADTIYTLPSVEYLRDEFRKAKELGFNCLRCHIKSPDPRYLDLADEMGLLVWSEIPSWRTFYPKGIVHANQLNLDDRIQARVEQTMREMIRRDFNHPSIVIWTIVNEDWGTAVALSASDRAWLARMYEHCKQLDPTRLIVDNSACPGAWGPNLHVKSDLDDFHLYANIPDQAKSFEQSIEQYNLRPLWTWSNHGDSQRRGDEPLILSEFGNWGLPSLDLLREHDLTDPPWFTLGPWWSPVEGAPGWPRSVEERFKKFGLDTVWKDYEAFATATQWHQFASLKFQIETLRRQPALKGYVITELADIYWESNGLLDFSRNRKVYHDAFAPINSPDMIIPQPDDYAVWDDQQVCVNLYAAHYSEVDWSNARLSWHNEVTRGEREITTLPRGSVRGLETKTWNVPKVEQTRVTQFQLAIHAGGRELARNTLDLLVLPASARRAEFQGSVTVIASESLARLPIAGMPEVPTETPDAEPEQQPTPLPEAIPSPGLARLDLETSIRQLGYRTTKKLTPDTQVVVTNYPNAELVRWVREGGDMLFFSSGPSPFFWVQGRSGPYSGHWITSFNWLRPGIYKRLQVSNPLGLPFRQVIPIRTILGLPMEDAAVQSDFLAGMISGWVWQPTVHTVQFRYGRGRVIMTTFAFDAALRDKPAAIALFHDLIDHLTSDACQPVLQANY